MRHRPHLLVGLEDIRDRAGRDNAGRVQHEMAGHVVLLDVLELRRLLERRHGPVEMAEPAVDEGVAAADVADVAFEVLHVDGVEAHRRHVQAHVGFGQVGAEVVRALGRG